MKKNKNLLAEQSVMDDVSIAKITAALLGIEYPGDEYFVSDTPEIKTKKEIKRELKAQKRQSREINTDVKDEVIAPAELPAPIDKKRVVPAVKRSLAEYESFRLRMLLDRGLIYSSKREIAAEVEAKAPALKDSRPIVSALEEDFKQWDEVITEREVDENMEDSLRVAEINAIVDKKLAEEREQERFIAHLVSRVRSEMILDSEVDEARDEAIAEAVTKVLAEEEALRQRELEAEQEAIQQELEEASEQALEEAEAKKILEDEAIESTQSTVAEMETVEVEEVVVDDTAEKLAAAKAEIERLAAENARREAELKAAQDAKKTKRKKKVVDDTELFIINSANKQATEDIVEFKQYDSFLAAEAKALADEIDEVNRVSEENKKLEEEIRAEKKQRALEEAERKRLEKERKAEQQRIAEEQFLALKRAEEEREAERIAQEKRLEEERIKAEQEREDAMRRALVEEQMRMLAEAEAEESKLRAEQEKQARLAAEAQLLARKQSKKKKKDEGLFNDFILSGARSASVDVADVGVDNEFVGFGAPANVVAVDEVVEERVPSVGVKNLLDLEDKTPEEIVRDLQANRDRTILSRDEIVEYILSKPGVTDSYNESSAILYFKYNDVQIAVIRDVDDDFIFSVRSDKALGAEIEKKFSSVNFATFPRGKDWFGIEHTAPANVIKLMVDTAYSLALGKEESESGFKLAAKESRESGVDYASKSKLVDYLSGRKMITTEIAPMTENVTVKYGDTMIAIAEGNNLNFKLTIRTTETKIKAYMRQYSLEFSRSIFPLGDEWYSAIVSSRIARTTIERILDDTCAIVEKDYVNNAL